MNKHDNIYNILNKLSALEPPAKQESILKNLSESQTPAQKHLSERLAEKYEGWKNTLQAVKESDNKTMSRAAKGNEKYGKDGMKALAKAGREGASEKELDKIRDKHNKYDESVEVDEDMLAKKDYDGDGKRETGKAEYMGSRDKAIKKAMGKSKEEGNEFSGELDKARDAGKDSFKVGGKTYPVKEGLYEELQADDGRHYDNADDFFSTIEGDWLDREEESEDGMEVRGYIDDVNVMVFRYDDESKTSGYGLYDDEGLNNLDETDSKSWMKDPSDPASKVPAYQRKANEPGRQAAQDRADSSNAKVGAKVFRSGRAAPMEEEQYDENDAHSSLPGVRKTTDKEHKQYDAAAHEIRKWMRKRGWNTNKEFKSALKYIMDNLDAKHDDSLTHRVKEAARICEKHHATMVEAGLDMNLLKGAQGAMRGVNTDPESERNRGKKYGYRSDRDDTGNDDDYDEHGNEKKGVKKSAPGDAPKKKGRPKKNFGPERVTAKAYKHKGERKTNEGRAIDLEHYVEDTMAELEAMFIVEKAKSKSQQRFFGMVHAAQKGEKPASKEVAKVAKSMGKQDAKDFAKTKHKGLPNKVSEAINYAEMMRETNQTVEEMLNELHGEMDEYKRTGYMGDKLRDALDIHRHSKKLMDNEVPTIDEVPAETIGVETPPPASIQPTRIDPVRPNSLKELAKLAGIEPIQEEPNEGNEFSGARADAIRSGKDTFSVGGKTYQVTDAEDEQVNEGTCNMTAEGQYCEVHGMEECGMMEGAKPDYIDIDKDGNKKEPMKKAAKEKTSESADYEKQIPQGMDDKRVKFKCPSCGTATNAGIMRGNNYVCPSCEKPLPAKNQMPLGECGDMGPMSGMDQQDGISINTSMDTKTGRKTVTVTADGDAAEELAQMLKMAGMVGGRSEPKVISLDNELDEYANDPDEKYASTDAIIHTGNDLNKPKSQDPGTANRAANPLGETAVQEDKLFKLYKSLKDIV